MVPIQWIELSNTAEERLEVISSNPLSQGWCYSRYYRPGPDTAARVNTGN